MIRQQTHFYLIHVMKRIQTNGTERADAYINAISIHCVACVTTHLT